MKKILIIILGIAFLSSCSNDDDTQNNQIIGEWKLLEAQFFGFGGQSSTDYSNENIIYNFQSNGILKVTGGQNVGYPSGGEYDYFFGEDYLAGGTTAPKILSVKINGSKWTYNLINGKMKLGKSYVDGPDLILERKYWKIPNAVEVADFSKDITLKKLVETFEGDKELLEVSVHTFAQKLLEDGELESAWKVLLYDDY